MNIVEVVIEGWFLPYTSRSFILYPFIFYQDIPQKNTRRHEWTHIKQIEKEGIVIFHIKNRYNNLRYGYRDNPYEVEARANEYNEEYNPWETR